MKYYTTLTDIGAAALANAVGLGQVLKVTSFVVSDGGGPDFTLTVEQAKQKTDVVNVLYEGGINQLKPDPNNPARYFIEGVVPIDRGGFVVREVGWRLDDGRLFAISVFPDSYKTLPSDGAATELPIRTYVATGAVDNIQLKIDPTVVLATRHYVDALFHQHLENEHRVNTDLISSPVKLSTLNVFTQHKTLSLPVVDNEQWFSAVVHSNVDLNAGECAYTAPDGEQINHNGTRVPKVWFTKTNEEFRFIRINGEWCV